MAQREGREGDGPFIQILYLLPEKDFVLPLGFREHSPKNKNPRYLSENSSLLLLIQIPLGNDIQHIPNLTRPLINKPNRPAKRDSLSDSGGSDPEERVGADGRFEWEESCYRSQERVGRVEQPVWVSEKRTPQVRTTKERRENPMKGQAEKGKRRKRTSEPSEANTKPTCLHLSTRQTLPTCGTRQRNTPVRAPCPCLRGTLWRKRPTRPSKQQRASSQLD